MTLKPVRLDDLTWDEMMAAILRRIPAESDGHWTLHAPVDPGVTLLELFAWSLEQRLYWLDQVPDGLVQGVLRLLGQEDLKPAQVAGTVLRTHADNRPAPLVPAGTAFTRDPRQEVVFTTDQPTLVLPVTQLTLEAGGQDRTTDLQAGRGVPLLPADGGPGEARITLHMPAPVAAEADAWLSLLLELATSSRVPPQWAPNAVGDVPPPAVVNWWYESPEGVVLFPPAEIADGTQGLRRSGVVRLRLPDAWRGLPAAATHPHGLRLRTEHATFSAAPRLRQLASNVAVARHRQVVEPAGDLRTSLEKQIARWLRLPGQALEIPGARGRLLAATLELRESDGQIHPWTATGDLGVYGRDSRVFLLDRATGELRFGDGRTGRIPVPQPGDPLGTVTWTIGGGTEGNGGTNGNWQALDLVGVTADNLVAADGGQDAETIAEARLRAAAALRIVHRAVTASDHTAVAITTPGVDVQRAHVAVGAHPAYPCASVPGAVTVLAVPGVPRGEDNWSRADFVAAPALDPGAQRAVCDRLAQARLLGAEVFLRRPVYRPVWLRVDVAGFSADRAAVHEAIRDRLRRHLDPLVGGDEGDGWPFGQTLRASGLIRVAQSAVGTAGEVTAVRIWVEPDGPDESCRDVRLQPHELVTLQNVQVRFTAAVASSEGLQ